MNELEAKNEKPLLVVKYAWWRVLYSQVSNLMLIGAGSIIFVGECTYLKCLVNVPLFLVLIISLYAFIDILLTRQLSFYRNRIVKTYYLFGDNILYLTSKTIFSKGEAVSRFITFSNNKIEPFRFRFAKISIPIEALGTGKTYFELLDVLSDVSGRNILEFEDVSPTLTLDPLIKQAQQRE